MISLFLVEDEKISREGIRNIAWKENGILYLGDAPDGDIALPQILEKKPDILLTDIKMPFINGLQLSQLVKEKLPDIKIILLSGYNEFDYAKQAISIGINEYLLKPVSSTDILNSVNKVKKEIETLRQKKREEEYGLTIQHQLFLNALFSGYLLDTSDIIRYAEKINIHLYSQLYQVLILHIAADSGFLMLDKYRTFLMPPIAVLAFIYNNSEIIYLLQSDNSDQLTAMCSDLENWIKNQATIQNLRVNFQRGTIVRRISDITKSYNSAKTSFISENKEQLTSSLTSIPFKREDLLEFLRTGKISTIECFWEYYIPTISQALNSIIYRYYLYTEIFFTAAHFVEEMGINLSTPLINIDQLKDIVLQNDSIEKFNNFVYNLFSQVMTLRDEISTEHSIPIAMQAKRYIDNNYANPDLSLSSVANAICTSPNYLSTVFKEKIGTNFSEYLTEVRIRQAEKLLATTDLSISEIALRVGYQNINYFSMTFKKVTGNSPSKYQRKKV